MFDILVYLFENYFQADATPDTDALARKLTAAGFESDEIHEALDWLKGLEDDAGAVYPEALAASDSARIYSEAEFGKLDTECRGFLFFLEGAAVLNPLLREIIIERAMALSEDQVSLSKLKVIVLMVLWSQHQTMDTLILEELLSDTDQQTVH